MFVAGLAGASWLLLGWIGPWRYRLRQEARERRLARDLVAAWGIDTLAPFVLRADKSYFFSSDERAFLAYRVVGGVAIVSGDPVGPPEAYGLLLDQFTAFARERGWRLAILGASERCLELYRARGLHALYHGDEAVVETESFSLEGGRSARCASRSTGSSAPATAPRCCARGDRPAPARRARGDRARRGAAPSPSAAS